MEVVRRFLDADILKTIIPLPDSFRNRRLEVIVLPVEQDAQKTEELRVHELIQSLTGAIPGSGMTLEEFRAERLQKYETAD